MDARTARMIASALRSAAQATTDASPPAIWQLRRDRLVDALDPATDRPSDDALRDMVDFLGETAPSRTSRQTEDEWATTVDLAVQWLLADLD